MIVAAHLVNFLSYADTWVQFGPMTVIVGSNKSGKSNLRRALEWCLLNRGSFNDDPAIDAVRRKLPSGELAPSTEVTVVFDDGASIRRYRDTGGANLYTIVTAAGETMEIGGEGSSVGQGPLMDVFDACGVGVIEYSDGTKAALQFSNDQQDGLFLLGDGMETIDKRLGVVLGVETLEAATKQAATHATRAQRALTTERDRVKQLEAELDVYADVDKCVQSLDVLDTLTEARDNTAAEAWSADQSVQRIFAAKMCLLPDGALDIVDAAWQQLQAEIAAGTAAQEQGRIASEAARGYLGWQQRTVVTEDQLTTIGEVEAHCRQLMLDVETERQAATHAAAHLATQIGASASVAQLNEQIAAEKLALDTAIANQVVCPLTGEIEGNCGAREKQA